MLAGVVVARLVLHAVFLPPFEGPDEPFHLARAYDVASGDLAVALRGDIVDPAIVAAIRGTPCCPDLGRQFGCPPFVGRGEAFAILERRPVVPDRGAAVENYERHQPPLSYLIAGGVLRVLSFAPADVTSRLLVFRLLGVAFVAMALAGPLRCLSRDAAPGLSVAVLLLLLFPGAAESLARAANDSFVFAWSALLLWRAGRSDNPVELGVIAAVGPLLKLTALPVVAAVAAAKLIAGRRAAALSLVAGSTLVLPVQAVRGWAWGGTLELNLADGAIGEPAAALLAGLGRSAYTFLKTTLWLGGWSFFRAPLALLLAMAALAIFALIRVRTAGSLRVTGSHLIGLGVAVAGFLAFALGSRRLFGTWGGTGGWYFWGWFPWLAVAARDCLRWQGAGALPALWALAALAVAANVLWFARALALYGV